MKTLLLSLLLLGSAGLLPAQDEADTNSDGTSENSESNAVEEQGPRRFWQASLSGGHYMVALDRISSISMHEYLLDANLVVHEMVVDTSGRALARFYYLEPITDSMNRNELTRVSDRAREMLDRGAARAGTDAHNMVQKQYPTTTHAGTIEYRLLDLRDLDALYASLQKAWETGRGRKVTVK